VELAYTLSAVVRTAEGVVAAVSVFGSVSSYPFRFCFLVSET